MVLRKSSSVKIDKLLGKALGRLNVNTVHSSEHLHTENIKSRWNT